MPAQTRPPSYHTRATRRAAARATRAEQQQQQQQQQRQNQQRQDLTQLQPEETVLNIDAASAAADAIACRNAVATGAAPLEPQTRPEQCNECCNHPAGLDAHISGRVEKRPLEDGPRDEQPPSEPPQQPPQQQMLLPPSLVGGGTAYAAKQAAAWQLEMRPPAPKRAASPPPSDDRGGASSEPPQPKPERRGAGTVDAIFRAVDPAADRRRDTSPARTDAGGRERTPVSTPEKQKGSGRGGGSGGGSVARGNLAVMLSLALATPASGLVAAHRTPSQRRRSLARAQMHVPRHTEPPRMAAWRIGQVLAGCDRQAATALVAERAPPPVAAPARTPSPTVPHGPSSTPPPPPEPQGDDDPWDVTADELRAWLDRPEPGDDYEPTEQDARMMYALEFQKDYREFLEANGGRAVPYFPLDRAPGREIPAPPPVAAPARPGWRIVKRAPPTPPVAEPSPPPPPSTPPQPPASSQAKAMWKPWSTLTQAGRDRAWLDLRNWVRSGCGGHDLGEF